ncbi:type II toxin-antitoxin system Phd/YefM family antitoxin [Luteimicrobium sp. DT211]|uniref:type II toxin-antitoxin system Phd/YefM family antitoxin n=1 Tax=Luteimicrobium sp. DT211 TaxID=3393412 RepID=UPI003CF2771C
MNALTASEARAALPSILDRVEQGEEVTITRHGRAVAVVVRPDLLRARRRSDVWDEADRIATLLDAARRAPATTAPGLTPGRADELVARIRADRNAR